MELKNMNYFASKMISLKKLQNKRSDFECMIRTGNQQGVHFTSYIQEKDTYFSSLISSKIFQKYCIDTNSKLIQIALKCTSHLQQGNGPFSPTFHTNLIQASPICPHLVHILQNLYPFIYPNVFYYC